MNALWGIVLGTGIFEAISGAAISLTQNLRASVEIGLILHVLIGAAFLFPLSLYLWRHIRLRKDSCDANSMRWGYAAFMALPKNPTRH